MAKKVLRVLKLQIQGGMANPSPPVGPALGQFGVAIMDFCKAFNAETQEQKGTIIPVIITVYADRSFTFITKTPPVAVLIKKETGLDKGSSEPNKAKVGKIKKEAVKRIAEQKMVDLNTDEVEAAMKIVAGTARSMGITVEN